METQTSPFVSLRLSDLDIPPNGHHITPLKLMFTVDCTYFKFSFWLSLMLSRLSC